MTNSDLPRVVLAAGGVVVRRSGGIVEFAVVHRPHHDDWSLPKGKIEAGESLAETALREVTEETGYSVELQQFVGVIWHPVRDKVKVVLYWLMKPLDAGEVANPNEIDAVVWMPIDAALARLTYETEREIIKKAGVLCKDSIDG